MNRPRSPVVTEGFNRAPQRAFFKSMGRPFSPTIFQYPSQV